MNGGDMPIHYNIYMYIDNCSDFVQGAPGTDVIIIFFHRKTYFIFDTTKI